jgi:four helix bundle protein
MRDGGQVDERRFKDRTKWLALQVVKLAVRLPRSPAAEVIGRQIVRSATSVGANYRASCRGKSVADVIAKLSIVEEEADETLYWLELLEEAGFVAAENVRDLRKETNEIVAMTVASIKTLRSRLGSPSSNRRPPGDTGPKSKITNPK